MPHLQFETTADPTAEERRRFADHMETGSGHVAVTIRVLDESEFSLGRLGPGEAAVMLNADVRRGRTDTQKRSFVLAAFDTVHERWDVPTEHMYAVLTEHDGGEFHEYGRTLSSWDEHEADEGAD